MTNHKIKNLKGFLLFEVMIAVIVLSVGIAMVLRSFNTAISAVKGIQDYTNAMFILEEKIFQEETGQDAQGTQPAPADELNKFSSQASRSAVEGLALDKIDASVTWKAAKGNRKFSAITYCKQGNQ